MNPDSLFETDRPIFGMVHLPALPGAPGYDEQGGREAILDRALADAQALADGGVDGLIVENYGDAPFYPEAVPKHVVAELTRIADRIATAVDLPLGINVLRNDATAALSIAAAVDAAFVRVNVHTGARVTDQGVIEGQAHETLRLRDRIDADVAVLADVAVKHSASLGERDLSTAVADAIERGKADGLVVSGPATGAATDTNDLRRVTDRRDDVDASVPVFVGSGVTAGNVRDLLAVADGAIVGTALKEGGETTNPVDGERVARVVAARDE
ncbi:BtpA/SgcQ family protein [Halorientalis salina]|uniref:BtpA/SgcQ family protein n=1 Tax=Halorientalis salina TaxID=2932266 RepID=UPI0010AD1B5F|nr:BtpA/SgcQ family protein [Halorientalis salina]